MDLVICFLNQVATHLRGVSNQSKLPTRFINLKIFKDFKSLKKLEYTISIESTVNNIFSLYKPYFK